MKRIVVFKAPPLSAGFITTSFRLTNDLKAKCSSVLMLKVQWPSDCKHRASNYVECG